MFEYSEEYLAELIQGLFDGTINPVNLPENLYAAIVKNLDQAVSNGFRSVAGNIHFGGPDYQLLQQLRENIYLFSAAKTFQQTLEMSHALIDPATGDIRSFKDFEDKAQQIFDKYNRNWLRSEYETAQLQAGNAAKWQDIEAKKDVLPYLRYISVQDRRVCEICNPLNNITLPVEDPFWKRYSPSNHFNCRCILEQLDQVEGFNASSDKRSVDKAKKDSKVPVEFQYNPGQLKEIFPTEGRSKHPYFIVPKEYQEFAKINFGLPVYDGEGNPSIDNLKQIVSKRIQYYTGLKPSTVQVHPSMSEKKMVRITNQLTSLLKEYKVDLWVKTSRPEVLFASSAEDGYGFVRPGGPHGRHAAIFNFGHEADPERIRPFNNRIRYKSKVDPEKLEIATVTHEFAHLIAIEPMAYTSDIAYDFFSELIKIGNRYQSKISKFKKLKDMAGLEKYHIGKYANTQISEFMAEAFTEYKLCSNPSPFAIEVGELIDKYFKRNHGGVQLSLF